MGVSDEREKVVSENDQLRQCFWYKILGAGTRLKVKWQ
jgi:hypothetical protein